MKRNPPATLTVETDMDYDFPVPLTASRTAVRGGALLVLALTSDLERPIRIRASLNGRPGQWETWERSGDHLTYFLPGDIGLTPPPPGGERRVWELPPRRAEEMSPA